MDASRTETIHDYFAGLSAPQHARPIMTSLNGDNSWLLSFPRPKEEQIATGKTYYHILFEPWLNGPTSNYTSWMVHIRLSEEAAVADAEGVISVARQIEEASASKFFGKDEVKPPRSHYDGDMGIDAIFLGLHILDHLHEPTLRLFDSRIPVIATPEVADIVRHWNYFTNISLISDLTPCSETWQSPEQHPDGFPSWLTAVRLPGHHELNFATAIVWTHSSSYGNSEQVVHETILHSPHGTLLDEGPLQAFLESEPRTQNLVLMHGLKESYYGGKISTLGAEGGLALYRRMGGARYWIKTHNSELIYSGLLVKALGWNDTPRSLEWALEKEKRSGGSSKRRERPILIHVPNGGSFVLE